MSPKPLGLRLSEHIRSCSAKGEKCTRETCTENRKIREEYERIRSEKEGGE